MRNEINTYIKHDSMFDQYLDEICNNTVGNTMLRLLVANMKIKPPKNNLEIILGKDEEQNVFFSTNNRIRMNFDLYTDGIKNKAQYGINEKRELVERRSHIAESLFHELCHAFHHISAINKTNSTTLEYLYKGDPEYIELWDGRDQKTDEELFNITGKFYNGTDLCFDPINCNMFDICYSCMVGRPVVQRMFHCYKRSLPDKAREMFSKLLINISDYILTKN